MREQIAEVGSRVISDLEQRQKHPELYRPIPFGITQLTESAGGIVMPSYIAIGGGAKIGKTALAIHMAHIIGAAGRGTITFYTLEETQWQVGVRSLTKLTTSVNRNHIRDLVINENGFKELKEANSKLEKLDYYVENEIRTAEVIIAKAKKDGDKFIIVDYLQYLEDKVGKNEVERLREVSKMFVRARNNDKLTSIVIYQLGDSGKADYTRSVYKDADLIIEVYPAIDTVTDTPKPGQLWLQILDSRQTERTKKIPVSFEGAHNRITDMPSIDLNTMTTHNLEQLEANLDI